MQSSRLPLIIAVIVLLLPVCYVVSYLALVQPRGVFYPRAASPYTYQVTINGQLQFTAGEFQSYRAGNQFCERFFWPLEQLDRKLRPAAWQRPGW